MSVSAPQLTAHEAFVADRIDTELGRSAPESISQNTVNDFARATGDLQWIHVDPKRAQQGPFGRTVAHGYLLLALLPALTRSVIDATGVESVINYGLERVRFVGAVGVDMPFTDTIVLSSLRPKNDGLLVGLQHTIADAASGETLCVAEALSLYRGIA